MCCNSDCVLSGTLCSIVSVSGSVFPEFWINGNQLLEEFLPSCIFYAIGN
jgi:hypothetical protein